MRQHSKTWFALATAGVLAMAIHTLVGANRVNETAPEILSPSASTAATDDPAMAPRSNTERPDSAGQRSGEAPRANSIVVAAPVIALPKADRIYRTAQDAQTALDALIPLMDAGDTRAMYAVRQVIFRCMALNHPEQVKATAPPGSEVHAQQQLVISRMTRYCNDARALSPGSAEIEGRAMAGLRAAARRGDPAGLAENIDYVLNEAKKRQMSPQQQVNLLLSMAQNSRATPELTRAALRGLVNVQADYAQEVIGVRDRYRAGFIRAYAAEILACERGAPCSPGQWAYADSLCMSQQNCAPNLGLVEVVRQQALSGGDYQAMQRYIAYLRERMREIA